LSLFYQDFKLGVLGGGQLGRMLIQSAIDFNIDVLVLDPDPQAPCSCIAHRFTAGDLQDYDTVYRFGQACDLITIEIEKVNTQALKALRDQGKKVFPQPEVIELIQDKRSQKQFYRDHGIPTADFVLVENLQDLRSRASFLPAVNKIGRDGYDGRGVQVMRTAADLERGFDAPGLLERLVDFACEISVLVARNTEGALSAYPVVELEFHPEANLVEFLFSPAQIDPAIAGQAIEVAGRVITQLDMVGLLAVEMFVTRDGEVLVNEIAPRPHNSGHHTIEANITSQYEQHLRAILGMPLGPTDMRFPAIMVNLLGEEGHSGEAYVEGLREVLATPGAHIHLYGKKITRPFRKMGHITLTGGDLDQLKETARKIKGTVKIKT
jgi:5-(carboxyamino)imidazole ribonucleotide synthase